MYEQNRSGVKSTLSSCRMNNFPGVRIEILILLFRERDETFTVEKVVLEKYENKEE